MLYMPSKQTLHHVHPDSSLFSLADLDFHRQTLSQRLPQFGHQKVMTMSLSLLDDPISHELTLSTEEYCFVFSLRTGKLNHHHAIYQLNMFLRCLQNQK